MQGKAFVPHQLTHTFLVYLYYNLFSHCFCLLLYFMNFDLTKLENALSGCRFFAILNDDILDKYIRPAHNCNLILFIDYFVSVFCVIHIYLIFISPDSIHA